ncbi:MAG TPA: hypothetical protein VFO01_03445 [Trebonia sp.]|nr:hypothetical protein [Trebonia sp.]
MTQDLSSVAAELRLGGGDTTAIEVKAAAAGLPESLAPTLSAPANLPGGGTVILGLDERAGFRPVPLADPQALKQGTGREGPRVHPRFGLTWVMPRWTGCL